MVAPENTDAAGMLQHLRQLAASLTGYLQARLRLFGIESKEAFRNYLALIVLVVIGLALLLFGYLFICIGLIALTSIALQIHWFWTALAFGLLHIVLAIVCGFIAKSRLAKPVYQTTLAELRKDQEWLTPTPKQN